MAAAAHCNYGGDDIVQQKRSGWTIKGSVDDTHEGQSIVARLAVIESKLETLISEVAAIRAFVPSKLVEYGERIVVLERNTRTMQWLAGVFAATMIGAFLAHVLAR